MTINLETLSKITGSELNGNSIEFKSLSIDSRTIQKDETFLCIKGKNFDGHNFIEQAISAGASSIIISKDIVTKLPRILIKDAHSFLNRFSEFKRRNFNGKVVCLTGSNGKTTTKDLIAHILSSNGSVFLAPIHLQIAISNLHSADGAASIMVSISSLLTS